MGRISQANPNPPPPHRKNFQQTSESAQTGCDSRQPGVSQSDYPPEYAQADQPEVSFDDTQTGYDSWQPEASLSDYPSEYPQAEQPDVSLDDTQTGYASWQQPEASPSIDPPEYLPTEQQEFLSDNYDDSTFQVENPYDDYESSFQIDNPDADYNDYESSYQTNNPDADFNDSRDPNTGDDDDSSPLPYENVAATQPTYPPPPQRPVPRPTTQPTFSPPPQRPAPRPATQPGYAPRPPTHQPGNFPARQQPLPPTPNRPANGPRSPAYPPGNIPAGAQPYPPRGQVNASQPKANFPRGNLNGGPQQFPATASQPVTYVTTQSTLHPGATTPGIPVQQVYHPSPIPLLGHNFGTEAWSSGLFDCTDDPELTVITCLCPCLTFGQIAEIIDNGHTTCATSGTIYGGLLLVLLPCLISGSYRTRLRNRYSLVETPAPDWITHFLCEWCALCQEYRELKKHGWDPALGLHGNIAIRNQSQQSQATMMKPPMSQSMTG